MAAHGGVLIDTSVLIAIERGALDLTAVASDPHEPLAMSAVTAHELLRGAARLPPGVRRARSERWLETLLGSVPVIEYDLDIARVHAALWAEMSASGHTLGEHDQMIAATAISLGYDLATRDAAFDTVPDLAVRRW
ncbi:MAG: PIN domain-containing protein [Acidobacteriota bacterium]|nr:PIN domain-containing protein [Acidobacteriota bacterium]